MRSLLLSLFIIVVAVACDPAETSYGQDHSKFIKPGEVLNYCTSELNIPTEILFYTSGQVVNKMEVPELAEPFTSYYITDVLGRVYAINSDEMNNYKCYEVVAR